ncbi:MAG TPA: TetR/AcrR family transcriptional regulator [Myxococcota bacterium]|nr:TetR/AcrR family transcriptional regulator [Myxococcota bacterium]
MSVAPLPIARTSVAGRKVLTQQKILRASMELFATRGYHRTSTSQIAARAGVSRASIFWHFSDKATLFGETCRHFLVPFRESLERGRKHGDPRERIVRQIDAYESFIREQRATIRAFVGWIFASQPHALPLRDELLALHREFQAGLARDLAALLADPAEAPALAAMTVAVLHGELLITLGRETPYAASPRAALERLLFEHISPNNLASNTEK